MQNKEAKYARSNADISMNIQGTFVFYMTFYEKYSESLSIVHGYHEKTKSIDEQYERKIQKLWTF